MENTVFQDDFPWKENLCGNSIGNHFNTEKKIKTYTLMHFSQLRYFNVELVAVFSLRFPFYSHLYSTVHFISFIGAGGGFHFLLLFVLRLSKTVRKRASERMNERIKKKLCVNTYTNMFVSKPLCRQ